MKAENPWGGGFLVVPESPLEGEAIGRWLEAETIGKTGVNSAHGRTMRLEFSDTARKTDPDKFVGASIVRMPAIGQRVWCDGLRYGVVVNIELRAPRYIPILMVAMDGDHLERIGWHPVRVEADGANPKFVEIAIREC